MSPRYKRFILAIVLATVVASVLSAAIPSLTGLAFNEVLRSQPDAGQLLTLALALVAVVLVRGAMDLERASPPSSWQSASSATPATNSTSACSARARPSTIASGSATSWPAPPTTCASSAT